MSAHAPTTMGARVRRYGPAQRRVVAAALDLFADHGVGGTSLQMIADAVGVTKAAVYHQFQTKDAIVVAVAEAELEQLEGVLDAAEAEASEGAARDAVLRRAVDLAVTRRRAVGAFQSDPVFVRLLASYEPFHDLIARFTAVVGGGTGPQARVRAAAISSAIAGTVVHPFLADLDDEALRAELLAVVRGLAGPG